MSEVRAERQAAALVLCFGRLEPHDCKVHSTTLLNPFAIPPTDSALRAALYTNSEGDTPLEALLHFGRCCCRDPPHHFTVLADNDGF